MSGTFPNIITCVQRFPHVSITVWTAVNGSCWATSASATPRKEGLLIVTKHRTRMVFFRNWASEWFYMHHIYQQYEPVTNRLRAQWTELEQTLHKPNEMSKISVKMACQKGIHISTNDQWHKNWALPVMHNSGGCIDKNSHHKFIVYRNMARLNTRVPFNIHCSYFALSVSTALQQQQRQKSRLELTVSLCWELLSYCSGPRIPSNSVSLA